MQAAQDFNGERKKERRGMRANRSIPNTIMNQTLQEEKLHRRRANMRSRGGDHHAGDGSKGPWGGSLKHKM